VGERCVGRVRATASPEAAEPEEPSMPPAADVTVVVPAMNREALVGRALASVGRQSVAPARVLVVDDASDDGTAAAAEAAGAEVLRMPVRSGSGPARNAAIEAATTEWVAFLDSDDEWWPEHLATVLRHGGAGHDLVSTCAVSTGGRWLGSPTPGPLPVTPRTMLVPSDVVVTSATLVRREALLDAGLFRPLPRAQDMDVWIRVLERGSGVVVGEATATYHEHATQAVRDVELVRAGFERILDDYAERPWMSPRLRDEALARVVWDDLRAAQRARRTGTVLGRAGWLARRPHATRAVAQVLRQRARARARAAEQAGAGR